MRKIIWGVLAFLVLAASPAARAETIWVSTDTFLLHFDSASPGVVTPLGVTTGLQVGETLRGIDFRPLNGQLYALGSTGRLYTLDLTTGAATQVGAPFPLIGTRFGFDFNPTVDRIRVVSDQGQNFRLHPDTGAVVATDPELAFAASDVNSGDTPVVTGAAYTNNLAGATTTVLYDLELGNGVLVTQSPANNGTLNTIGTLRISPIESAAGFDISGRTGTAYTVLDTGSGGTLYRIDLGTGTALPVGLIGFSPVLGLTGLAIAPSEGPCVPSTTALCLSGDRFRVSATWELADGTRGAGQAIPLTGASGYFWFFSPDNIELDVKVLNACNPYERIWVFASGLTNVGVTLTVVDLQTGETRTYVNPVNRAFLPIQDTRAFDNCP